MGVGDAKLDQRPDALGALAFQSSFGWWLPKKICPRPPVVPSEVRWDDRGPGAIVGSSHTEPEEVRLEV